MGKNWSVEASEKKAMLARIAAGESIIDIAYEAKVEPGTVRRWIVADKAKVGNVPKPLAPILGTVKQSLTVQKSKILIYDIETLPNLGYFWDTYSDRAIPIDFVLKPKSICTIAYKWLGEAETYVLVIDTPYDDKRVLQDFIPEWSKADYVVAHYSRFDKPFIAARLMANGLPSLPPVNDICTYKLAKLHFGRSLNGNKLDHLGSILGVGNKIKTHADLWVKCAAGDKSALTEMAAYNVQDVDLLAKVFNAMLPYVKSKLNMNLMADNPVQVCKHCGDDKLEQRGFEYTHSTVRPRFICVSCGSWSSFPAKKHD